MDSETVNSIDSEINEFRNLFDIVAKNEGICDYSIVKGSSTVKGDGYNGKVKNFEIVGKSKTKDPIVLSIVVKYATKSDTLRNVFKVEKLYNRECHMFKNVFPVFNMLEDINNLPPSAFGAKFYAASLENKKEALILENLTASGYRLYERKMPMDKNHVKLVLDEYGRLHATSLALRDQNPESFAEIFNFDGDIFEETVTRGAFIDGLVDKCVKAKELLHPNADSQTIETYEKFLGSIREFFNHLPNCIDEYSVILHGDSWTNNMMFKYENEADKSFPTAVRLLDFQFSRLGSPVIDISYFLYGCSPSYIFNELDECLHIYYSSICASLNKFGCDPEKLLPFSVLKMHWEKYAQFGLIMAMIIIHIMLTETEEAIDLSETVESGTTLHDSFNYNLYNSEQYNKRVKDIILHFISNKFI